MLSYIEIKKDNLIHNIRAIKQKLPGITKVVAMIKANAYGHGLQEIARILEEEADLYGIDDYLELQRLRTVSEKEAVLLGYVEKADLDKLIGKNATISIYDKDRLHLLNSIARQNNNRVKIHIKIDASLGRQGILATEINDFIQELKQTSHIELEAVYTHFSNIEDLVHPELAKRQISELSNAVQLIRSAGYRDCKFHIDSSRSVCLGISSPAPDYIRVGLSLYGMYPTEELAEIASDLELKPVLRWVTHVAQVKDLPAGYPIGYGMSYITTRPTKIAVIPQGYADGYDRGLSNRGEVLIQGTRCKVLGKVAMTMFVVDVSHIPDVQAEEEVVLLGEQGNVCITAEEIAEKLDTINYEVTTRISPLLPRVVIEANHKAATSEVVRQTEGEIA
jgi:alanine racemase